MKVRINHNEAWPTCRITAEDGALDWICPSCKAEWAFEGQDVGGFFVVSHIDIPTSCRAGYQDINPCGLPSYWGDISE